MNKLMPTRKTWPVALAAALLIGGCAAVGPDYRAPAVQTPAAWSRQPGAGAAIGTIDAANLAQWWQQLDDPLLTGLIEEALASSPDVRSARAKLREARARRDLASANRLPAVGASANASRAKSSAQAGSGTTSSHYDAGFDASWEIDLFGGQRRAVEAAQADLDAGAADLDAARVTLAAEVARNYVELRSAQQRLAIARDNLASQGDTLQITDWRNQAGLASTLDVEQARTTREQTRAQIPVLETTLAQSANRLAILLGKTPGSLDDRLDAPAAIPAPSKGLAIGIPADTLRQRPDVLAAERRLAAQTARIGVAEAARWPSLSLSGSIGLEALTTGGLTAAGAVARSVAASIAGTLFDGGRLRQQVEIQDALREQTAVAYEQAVLAALEDVENALVSLGNAQRRRDALEAASESAHNAALLAQHRYAAGLTDFQSVLDTSRTVLNVEDSRASAQAEQATALIQLYKALGGGWHAAAATPYSPGTTGRNGSDNGQS